MAQDPISLGIEREGPEPETGWATPPVRRTPELAITESGDLVRLDPETGTWVVVSTGSEGSGSGIPQGGPLTEDLDLADKKLFGAVEIDGENFDGSYPALLDLATHVAYDGPNDEQYDVLINVAGLWRLDSAFEESNTYRTEFDLQNVRFSRKKFDPGDDPDVDTPADWVYFILSDGRGRLVGGDLEVPDIGKGLILKSPNGTRYRLKVGNDGTLSTEAV